MSGKGLAYQPVEPVSPQEAPGSGVGTHFQAIHSDHNLKTIPLTGRPNTQLNSAERPTQSISRQDSSTTRVTFPRTDSDARQARMPDAPLNSVHNYDAELGRNHFSSGSTSPQHTRPHNSRNPSWDLFAGIRKFEHSYEEFDSRNASDAHLAFADGDLPKSKFIKFYNYLLNVSIVTRWFLFIVPVLALLWIPGILGLTEFPNARIWNVKLVWWSVWLSVVWGSWWGAWAVSRVAPRIIRSTVGIVAIGTRRYIDWLEVLHRYVALFAWTLISWISYNPLIDRRQSGDASDNSKNSVDLLGRLLFAFYLCAATLLFEKFSIQWIAGKFHERSYAERIADQKFAVKSLATLYRHSVDIPGRTDVLPESIAIKNINPRKLIKTALKGVRMAATTTTTAFGNVASEIAGSSVLQPNSPQAMVKTALESANKSRLLARRIFYSFVKPGSDYLFVEDIAQFFSSSEEADQVFALFDKDSNGDASRDEVEMACMEFHREQLSIEHSMQDLDSAVGRLDNILMSLYVVIAVLIIAVALQAQLVTLVTGAGTLILGLSWLIGGSLQEVLTSIIFLFIKHPFDVGDRIVLETTPYTIKEIRLLSTIFLNSNGVLIQAPNTVLNTKFIQNIRRSPQMSETFTFDVSYSTSFEALEKLRDRMLTFLKSERRDYQPVFDVTVVDFPEQEKMTLTADIKYKSNAQQGALKAKRRNKWICALKTALADVKIFGPKGDPDADAPISKYTQMPWEVFQEVDRIKHHIRDSEHHAPAGDWHLTDKNAVLLDDSNDVFGEADQLHMTNPRRDLSTDQSHRSTAAPFVSMPAAMSNQVASSSGGPEHIEMSTRS